MNNQSGMIVRPDKSEFQEKIIGKDYDNLLTNAYIANKIEFRKAIQNVFVADGSYNLSYIFYNFGYRDEKYVKNFSQNIEYRIPVYGVRSGLKGTQRNTKFAAVYSCLMEDMRETAFFAHVFGTDYPSGEECIQADKNALVEKIDEGCKAVPLQIPAEERMILCHTLEKLWSLQEKNTSAKLIILMEHPEEKSMDFLKMLYMLIPSRMRMSMGFITNASNNDLEMIKKYNLPIYLLTMSAEELAAVKELDEKTYQVYDLSKADSYTYDPKKMAFLERLASSVSETQDSCLAYAEPLAMKEQGYSATQFALYQAILDKLFATDFLWWNKEKVSLLEDVQALWEEQKTLMAVSELREQAVYAFYTKLQEKSDFQKQLMKKIRNKATEDEQLLAFLKENLFLAPEMEAVTGLIAEMDHEKDLLEEKYQAQIAKLQDDHTQKVQTIHTEHSAEVEKLNKNHAETVERIQTEHNAAVQQMSADHTAAVERIHAEHEEAVLKLNTAHAAEAGDYIKRITNLSQVVESKDSEIRKQKMEKEAQKMSYEKEKAELDANLNKANSKIVNLENKIRDNDIDRLIEERDCAEEEKRRAQKQRRSARVGRTVLAITTGLFVAASAGLGYVGYRLNSDKIQLEKDNAGWKEKEEQHIADYQLLESEKTELENQNIAQSEKIADLETKNTDLETKNAELLKQQEEAAKKETEADTADGDSSELDYSAFGVSENGQLMYNGETLSWR